MATCSLHFMIMNFSCHFLVVFQNALPSSCNAIVKTLSMTANVLLVYHCYGFRRMPMHKKTQDIVGIAKPVSFVSHFCINTYQSLNVWEPAEKEEMECGTQAGGQVDCAPSGHPLDENCMHRVLLSIHLRTTPCITSSGAATSSVISHKASAWDEIITAHDHTSMPTAVLLCVIPLSQEESHQVTDT